jgi:hypothetical protein
MTWISLRGWWFIVALLPLTAIAAQPQAPARTHVQNYKDMVLATCIAQAYRNDAGAAVDAGSSASALRDWTYFDLDDSPDAVKALVDAYLARDYRNPLVEAEVKGVQFNFLKCLDLYHSKALEALAKRMVIEPSQATKPAATTN